MTKELPKIVEEVNQMSDEQIMEELKRILNEEKDDLVLKETDLLTKDYCYYKGICASANIDYNTITSSDVGKIRVIAYRKVKENNNL